MQGGEEALPHPLLLINQLVDQDEQRTYDQVYQAGEEDCFVVRFGRLFLWLSHRLTSFL